MRRSVRAPSGAVARALTVLALTLPALLPSAADAVPPYVVAGTGTFTTPFGPLPAEYGFSFQGTARDVLSATSPCSFAGYVYGTAGGAVGAASGSCAGVAYDGCATKLSAAQWTLVCMPGTGSFAVVVDPSLWTFSATGTFA